MATVLSLDPRIQKAEEVLKQTASVPQHAREKMLQMLLMVAPTEVVSDAAVEVRNGRIELKCRFYPRGTPTCENNHPLVTPTALLRLQLPRTQPARQQTKRRDVNLLPADVAEVRACFDSLFG